MTGEPARQPPVTDTALAAHADERELIAAVLRMDRKAAARLVAAHIDAVYAYARHRLVPHVELADDVVQDVFLAAFNGIAAFQGHSSLRVWLLGIARHKIEDVYRQRLRLAETVEQVDLSATEPASDARHLDEQIDLRRASRKARRILSQLPERYGLMLLWRYWEHRSAREMAAAVGTTEKSIERTLARARARFKELWVKEGRDDR